MKKLIIPIMIVAIFVAFFEQVSTDKNIYITVIAIAVFIENGYWGARWAGPIASLMIEKYLTGEVKRKDLEKRMMEGSLENEYKKQLEIGSYVAEKR